MRLVFRVHRRHRRRPHTSGALARDAGTNTQTTSSGIGFHQNPTPGRAEPTPANPPVDNGAPRGNADVDMMDHGDDIEMAGANARGAATVATHNDSQVREAAPLGADAAAKVWVSGVTAGPGGGGTRNNGRAGPGGRCTRDDAE